MAPDLVPRRHRSSAGALLHAVHLACLHAVQRASAPAPRLAAPGLNLLLLGAHCMRLLLSL